AALEHRSCRSPPRRGFPPGPPFPRRPPKWQAPGGKPLRGGPLSKSGRAALGGSRGGSGRRRLRSRPVPQGSHLLHSNSAALARAASPGAEKRLQKKASPLRDGASAAVLATSELRDESSARSRAST